MRYSGARRRSAPSRVKHGIPIGETIAGKGAFTHHHPAHVGPIGMIGSTSANALADEADVILAVGTRLQDFTTGSWTAFARTAQFVSINAARFDAVKHRALAVVGDALRDGDRARRGAEGLQGAGRLDARKARIQGQWDEALDGYQKPTNEPVPTYAQVVGIVNAKAGERDPLITAAGGLPGELTKNWRVKAPNTFDCEFGFSCMGYEIPAGWGAAMADLHAHADRHGRRRHLFDDELRHLFFRAARHKMILIVCDNGGFAVINRLQNGKGVPGFNNQIADCQGEGARSRVDFAMHAQSMGAADAACRQPRRARAGDGLG